MATSKNRRTPPRGKGGRFRKRKRGRKRNSSRNAIILAPKVRNRARRPGRVRPGRSNRKHRRNRGAVARRRNTRRNPARRNQRAQRLNIRTITRSLQKSFAMIGAGSIAFRLDDRFGGMLAELAGQDARSAAGKGIRAAAAVAVSIVADTVIRQRGKALSFTFTLGELIRNVLLLKIGAEVLQDNVEPALGLEPTAVDIAAPEAGAEAGALTQAQLDAIQPGLTAGFRGANGMGRTRGMGRVVVTDDPVFDTSFPA